MRNVSKEEALKIIVNSAKEYEVSLRNKHFLIVYLQRTEVKCVCVGFRDMNFLHLTGVQTKLSAKVFYSAALAGKLSVNNFEFDKAGRAQQKLVVLPHLHRLFLGNCMIGDFVNSGIYIRADYFMGDTKEVLSVGFRRGRTVDFPVTLYNESVKKLSRPVYKVLAIFAKPYNAKKYGRLVYLAKDWELEQLVCHEELKTCLNDKNGCHIRSVTTVSIMIIVLR